MTIIHKPSIVIEELGELGILPDGGIINAGGVAGSSFTVGGREVVVQGAGGSGPAAAVIGHEHIQNTNSALWTINHAKNSTKVQVSVWDTDNELIYADVIKIIDSDNITIKFNTPISGRAILMLF